MIASERHTRTPAPNHIVCPQHPSHAGMDELKAASLALAREALVPPNAFDPTSRSLTAHLEKLLKVLSAVPAESVTASVAEYVYFPLHSLLQQSNLGARATELLLRILKILISTAWRSKVVLDLTKARQLTAVITYLLSPEPPSLAQDSPLGPSKYFLESPTSLHAAGFECLGALFETASACGFGPDLGLAPSMAHIIAILLAGLQHDTADPDSQKQSIKTLTVLLQDIIINPDHRALVLPRIASKLAKFVAPSNRKHFSVKVLAIRSLQVLLLGCLSDASFSQDAPSKIRTPEWIQKTAEPLSQTFQVVYTLLVAVQSYERARPELIESLFVFASSVQSQCAGTLQQASGAGTGILLDMLLLCASQTVSLDVARKADEFIKQSDLAPKQLETSLVKRVQDLPSTIESPDEDKVLLALRSVQKALVYVRSPESHEAVLNSIMSSLPLSVAKKSSKQSAPPKQILAVSSFDPQENRMIRLSNLGLSLPLTEATQDLIYQIIFEMGKTRAVETIERLCDSLELMRSRGRGSLDGTLILWCVAALVRSMPRGSDMYDVVAYCYEEITGSMDLQGDSISEANPAKHAHTALCCYVVGEVALNQGSSFKDHLVDLIHPMFSMLGDSESVYVRREAQQAISKIAFSCGYENPAALALGNKDYLVDGISTQLNTMNFTPGTPSALAALIYISGSPIIPYLDDVFSSLFVLLDHYHGYSQLVKSILLVFGSLTSVIDKSIAELPAITATTPKSDFVPSFDELIAELDRKPEVDPAILEQKVDLDKLASERITEVTDDATEGQDSDKKHEDGNSSSEESDSDDDDEPHDLADQAVEKWDSPIARPIYETLEKIASYCDKLMTHESPEIRLAVLTLLTRLTPYLALNNEHFLPLVHKVWPEAISRVFDLEVYVVEEGFRCLSAVTLHAKDFVSARVDSLWPKLAEAFGSLFTRPWPQFSNERRTQAALVQFLVAVLDSIPNVSLVTMDSMMRVVRAALLRGEFLPLKTKLERDSSTGIQDLVWLVMQKEQVVPTNKKLHPIMPVYNF